MRLESDIINIDGADSNKEQAVLTQLIHLHWLSNNKNNKGHV